MHICNAKKHNIYMQTLSLNALQMRFLNVNSYALDLSIALKCINLMHTTEYFYSTCITTDNCK